MDIAKIIRLLVAVFALAWANVAAAVTADEVTSRAIDRFGKSPSVTATFTVTAQGRTASGSITVAGDRFHMTVDGMQTWYDGRTQWTYSPSTDEVSVTEPTADELAQVNPFAIVSSLRDLFTAKLVKSGQAESCVTYTPRNKMERGQLTVTYSNATSWPSQVSVANGADTVVIRIKQVSVGKTLHPSVFVYDKKLHPGAEIVDLR